MKVACLYLKPGSSLPKTAELCLRLSPQICFGKSALFIEIGKCHRLYSEVGFIARVQVLLRRLDYQARIAIADSIPEAFVKAKYNTHNVNALSLMALLDFADPFEKEELTRKSVQKMIEAFHELGIRNIASFRNIPLSELISRFGSISILCMQRLKNEIEMPWPFWKPAEIISERSDFPYFEFYGELEPILFKLKEQLDHIYQRLWARNHKLQKLQVRIFCETNSQNPEPFRHFEFEFLTPQGTTKATLNIVKERLARDFEKNPIRTPIEALESIVLATVPSTVGQKNLLNNHEEQLEQFHALIGQLAEVHGRDNVFHAALTEDRRPERSWKKIDDPFKSDAANKLDPKRQDWISEQIPLRPTHLVKPEKIDITEAHVLIRNRRFKISKWSEFVERITGGWSHRVYDRNYYQIELEGAPKICVFQTPDKKFFLHGYYG